MKPSIYEVKSPEEFKAMADASYGCGIEKRPLSLMRQRFGANKFTVEFHCTGSNGGIAFIVSSGDKYYDVEKNEDGDYEITEAI